MKQTTSLSRGKMLLIMQKIPFFRDFTQAERERIIAHAQFFVAQPNEKIITQDELDTAFYIMLNGKANVQMDDSDQVLATLTPGHYFGEISFVLNTPRSSHVIAEDLCILLRVDRRLMGALSAEIREKFKDQIINKFAKMITDANDRKVKSGASSE